MRKGLTELVFILDRSGSMQGLEKDTVGGYNSMLKRQEKEKGEVLISTVLFDDRIEVLHDRVPLEHISPMTEKEYYVRSLYTSNPTPLVLNTPSPCPSYPPSVEKY